MGDKGDDGGAGAVNLVLTESERVLSLEHSFLKAMLGLRENDLLLVENRRLSGESQYGQARQLLCTCSMFPLTMAFSEPTSVTSPGPVRVEMRLKRMVPEHDQSEVRYYQGRCEQCGRFYVADIRVEWRDA